MPEFECAAFDAQLGQPVRVKTQYGHHLLVVEDEREATQVRCTPTAMKSPQLHAVAASVDCSVHSMLDFHAHLILLAGRLCACFMCAI